jgi:hypothetical protein
VLAVFATRSRRNQAERDRGRHSGEVIFERALDVRRTRPGRSRRERIFDGAFCVFVGGGERIQSFVGPSR